jgi:hypothetical protein
MTQQLESSSRQQCRYLHPNGHRCLKPARRGEYFCHSHLKHRRPVLALTATTLPLLDDRSSIQLTLTQILQGIFTNTLDPKQGGHLLYGLQIAAALLPKSGKNEQLPAQEPIEEVTLTEEGEELAPESRYFGPNGKPEQRWDFSKYLYAARLKNKSLIDVTPADVDSIEFPLEGYLTEEEMENPEPLWDKMDQQVQEELQEHRRLRDANPPQPAWWEKKEVPAEPPQIRESHPITEPHPIKDLKASADCRKSTRSRMRTRHRITTKSPHNQGRPGTNVPMWERSTNSSGFNADCGKTTFLSR